MHDDYSSDGIDNFSSWHVNALFTPHEACVNAVGGHQGRILKAEEMLLDIPARGLICAPIQSFFPKTQIFFSN